MPSLTSYLVLEGVGIEEEGLPLPMEPHQDQLTMLDQVTVLQPTMLHRSRHTTAHPLPMVVQAHPPPMVVPVHPPPIIVQAHLPPTIVSNHHSPKENYQH